MKAITVDYTDFFGTEQKETFYFNLNQQELLAFLDEHGQHYGDILTELADKRDGFQLYTTVRDIIVAAYGKRSDDGKRFLKNPEITKEFEEHAAYDVVIDTIMSSPDSVESFIEGILPKGALMQVQAASEN